MCPGAVFPAKRRSTSPSSRSRVATSSTRSVALPASIYGFVLAEVHLPFESAEGNEAELAAEIHSSFEEFRIGLNLILDGLEHHLGDGEAKA